MKAAVGDLVVVHATHVDQRDREGEVIQVASADGSPPFRVRWSDLRMTLSDYPEQRPATGVLWSNWEI